MTAIRRELRVGFAFARRRAAPRRALALLNERRARRLRV